MRPWTMLSYINSSRLSDTYEAMNHAIIYELFSAQWHIWGHEPCYHIWTLLGSVTHMRPWTMLSYMNSSRLSDTYEAMNHAIIYKLFPAQWHIWGHEPCYHKWTLLGLVTHMRPWTMLSYMNSSRLSDTYEAMNHAIIYELFSAQWHIWGHEPCYHILTLLASVTHMRPWTMLSYMNSSRLSDTYEAMNHALIYKLFSAQLHIWGHEPCYHIWTLLGSVTHMRPWTMLSYINSSRLSDTYEAMNHAIIYTFFSALWHIWGHEPCYHIWTLLGSVTHMRPWTMLSYINSSRLSDTYGAMNHAIIYELFSAQWHIWGHEHAIIYELFSAQWHIWGHEPCYHIWTLIGSVTHMRPWTMISYMNSSRLGDTYEAMNHAIIYELFSARWHIWGHEPCHHVYKNLLGSVTYMKPWTMLSYMNSSRLSNTYEAMNHAIIYKLFSAQWHIWGHEPFYHIQTLLNSVTHTMLLSGLSYINSFRFSDSYEDPYETVNKSITYTHINSSRLRDTYEAMNKFVSHQFFSILWCTYMLRPWNGLPLKQPIGIASHLKQISNDMQIIVSSTFS